MSRDFGNTFESFDSNLTGNLMDMTAGDLTAEQEKFPAGRRSYSVRPRTSYRQAPQENSPAGTNLLELEEQRILAREKRSAMTRQNRMESQQAVLGGQSNAEAALSPMPIYDDNDPEAYYAAMQAYREEQKRLQAEAGAKAQEQAEEPVHTVEPVMQKKSQAKPKKKNGKSQPKAQDKATAGGKSAKPQGNKTGDKKAPQPEKKPEQEKTTKRKNIRISKGGRYQSGFSAKAPERSGKIARSRSYSTRITTGGAVTIGMLSVLLIGCVIYGRVQTNEIYSKIAVLQAEYDDLNTRNVSMKSEMESKMTVKNIEEYAKQKGLQPLDQSQIEYIQIQTEDEVDISEPEENIIVVINDYLKSIWELLRGK